MKPILADTLYIVPRDEPGFVLRAIGQMYLFFNVKLWNSLKLNTNGEY